MIEQLKQEFAAIRSGDAAPGKYWQNYQALSRATRQKVVGVGGGLIAGLALLCGYWQTFPGVWVPLSGQSSPVKSSAIGQFSDGDFRYDRVRIQNYRASDAGHVAGKLMVITATVTNTGKESSAPGLPLKIKDDKGREFNEAAIGYQVNIRDGMRPNDFVLPGQSREVYLGVFDVSPNAAGLKVIAYSGFSQIEVTPAN
jgi:hypothetical protein